MKRHWLQVVSVLAFAPLAVDVVPNGDDSSTTSFTVGVGSGDWAYVSRGCDNEVLAREKRHFRETGFAVKQDFRGAPEAGVRFTVLNEVPEYDKNAVVVNPHVAMEWPKFGVGVGGVFSPSAPADGDRDYDIPDMSAHLRAGRLDGFHVSAHLNEDVPITAGGGTLRIGLGVRPLDRVDVWAGIGVHPYDKGGFVARTDVHATRNLDLFATGRLGKSEGIKENAVSVGATVKLTRH